MKAIHDMNKHEHSAYLLVKKTYNWEIGGYMNTLSDCSKDDEDYIEAIDFLSDRNSIKEHIYACVMDEAKRFGRTQHIKFSGTDFINECIDYMINADGELPC